MFAIFWPQKKKEKKRSNLRGYGCHQVLRRAMREIYKKQKERKKKKNNNVFLALTLFFQITLPIEKTNHLLQDHVIASSVNAGPNKQILIRLKRAGIVHGSKWNAWLFVNMWLFLRVDNLLYVQMTNQTKPNKINFVGSTKYFIECVAKAFWILLLRFWVPCFFQTKIN